MEKVYTFEENKNSMADIRDFFEGLDLTNVDKKELKIIDLLKDSWANYYFNCVELFSSSAGEERVGKTLALFLTSNKISDEATKESLLDYTYGYIAEMNDEEIFGSTEYEDINKLLENAGLISIDEYFEKKNAAKK